MAFTMCYSTLRWQTPDLEVALEELKRAGWDGWEGRMPLDWLGPPARLRRVCADSGMPMSVYTASGSPDNTEWEQVERNRRRMEFAAEVEADCFMFMSGPMPEGRTVSDDDIRAAAEGAESWAEYASQFDLEVSYHIHTNTLVDSTEHWHLYMSCLRKAKLCIDVSHSQLWGYDPLEAIADFRDQLNYVHLQDYTSTSRREDGYYLPVWCDVGLGDNIDFPGILKVLADQGFDRCVTCCPGEPPPGDDPVTEAKRSSGAREYLKRLGY